jgi:hypothetical protein
VDAFTSQEPGTYTTIGAFLGPEGALLGAAADWLVEILHASPAAEELLKTGLEGMCNKLINDAKKDEPSPNHDPTLRRP